MSHAEYSLVKTLMAKNDGLRIIAVGDDDQNIYEFRGSSSEHFASLLKEQNSKKYELVDNYRSSASIIIFANQFAHKISKRLKTIPITPVKKEQGIVYITKIFSDNITIPAVNTFLAMKTSEKTTGSVCIITRTNSQALSIAGLLRKSGVAAKQIQTNNDFNLCNLIELRDFINDIENLNAAPAIDETVWQNAKNNLQTKYKSSAQTVLNLIADFEKTNNKIKHKSDFKQFAAESKLEDFSQAVENTVLVSTIHQTKGREFDTVILALSQFSKLDDAAYRAIYVAITRAKQNLHVIYNGNYFDTININGIEGIDDISDINSTAGIQKIYDKTDYPMPEHITMQLSHKDVVLNYFNYLQHDITFLRSGNELELCDTGCTYNNKQVLKFSSHFCKQIESLKNKGYLPVRGIVRHIVWWKGKDTNEIKIILPDVEFYCE
jgi:ATP-dependent DNA helicase RecQ